MANVNLIKQDNSTKVNITKGATQQALNSAVSQAESYKNESEGFSLDAEGFKNDASLSASQSAISATASATSARNSSTSATNATTQANIATTKASEASTSASNALVSETNASTYATNASNSASAASTSASNASTSASNALTYSNNASASANNAATSESNASSSATSANTSANNAAISEANALSYANSINPTNILHTIGNGNGNPEGYTQTEADTLLSAKASTTYVDAQDTNMLSSANSYTDTSISNIDYETNIAPYNRGFKNYIINGGFDIWQRGTSFTTSAYTADRWLSYVTGGAISYNNTIDIGNYAQVSINNITDIVTIEQRIENPAQFHNKTVTISYNIFGTPVDNLGIMKYEIALYHTGGRTSLIAGSTNDGSGRKSITLNIGDLSGYTFDYNSFLEIRPFAYISDGTWTGLIGINNVQLEEGSVATPFEQRPYGLELSLCQRYYEAGYFYRSGVMYNNTSGLSTEKYTVAKRTIPTVTALFTDNFINFTGVVVSGVDKNHFSHYPSGGTTNSFGRYRLGWSADAEL